MKSAFQIWKDLGGVNLNKDEFKKELIKQGVIVKKDLSYVHTRINIRSYFQPIKPTVLGGCRFTYGLEKDGHKEYRLTNPFLTYYPNMKKKFSFTYKF